MEKPLEMTEELMNKAVEDKGKEIYEMFLSAINDQITDAVTQIAPDLAHKNAKACALAHIKPFQSPFERLPKDKLEGMNGVALEKFEMVVEFWKGVETYLKSL